MPPKLSRASGAKRRRALELLATSADGRTEAVMLHGNPRAPELIMLLVGLLITGSLCLTFTPRTAVAGSGEVAAGIVGGLAVGTLFGAAVAGGPRYYQPAPVYVAPAPVYVAPPCYWTRGAPVWDGYRGIWYRPRIQVCD